VGLWRLTVKEMCRRPRGLVLSLAAVIVATGAYVSVRTMSWSAEDQLRKLTLRLGHNVLLVPHGAPHDRLWAADFGEEVMPEEYLDRIAEAPDIAALRYVAMLERRIDLDAGVAVLTGVRFELGAYGRARDKKPTPAGFDVYDVKRPDDAHLGADIARALKVREGDTITVEGRTFRVAAVRGPEGTIEDVRIYIQLKTAQEMANEAGQINALLALGCVCPVKGKVMLMSFIRNTIRDHFEGVAGRLGLEPPDVIMLRDKFEARAEARLMLQSVGLWISAGLLVLCGFAVALYIYSNAAGRRHEMAVLIALGYRPWRVAAALIAKVVFVGVVGGVGGLLLGSAVAVAAGPAIVAIRTIAPRWGLWWQALLFASGLCVAAAAVAVLGPARLLRNQ